jgi:hypothetical protein
LGEGRKEARKDSGIADYFIQNLIIHYLFEKKRGCVTEGERRGMGHLFRPMEYVIGFFL